MRKCEKIEKSNAPRDAKTHFACEKTLRTIVFMKNCESICRGLLLEILLTEELAYSIVAIIRIRIGIHMIMGEDKILTHAHAYASSD